MTCTLMWNIMFGEERRWSCLSGFVGISLDWWFKRNKDSKLSSQGWAKSAASDAGFGVRPPIAISCWIGIENLRSQLRRKPLAPPIHLLHWNAPVNSVVSANAQAIVKAASNVLLWLPLYGTSTFPAPMPTIGDRMPLVPFPNLLPFPSLFAYAAFGQPLGGSNEKYLVTSQNKVDSCGAH